MAKPKNPPTPTPTLAFGTVVDYKGVPYYVAQARLLSATTLRIQVTDSTSGETQVRVTPEVAAQLAPGTLPSRAKGSTALYTPILVRHEGPGALRVRGIGPTPILVPTRTLPVLVADALGLLVAVETEAAEVMPAWITSAPAQVCADGDDTDDTDDDTEDE